MTTDAAPSGWCSTLQKEQEMIAMAHGTWNKKQAKLTSNNRKIKDITQDLRCFAKILKNSRVQSLAIRNDNSTAVFDIRKWRASISLIREIKQAHQTIQKLGIQIQNTYLPGVKNEIADAQSRLSRAGDCKLKEKIFQQTCLQMNLNLTIYLFQQYFNKLLTIYMSTIKGHGETAIDALNQTWKMELPWIHPPIPLLPAVLKKIREEQIKEMIIAPQWPGQIWCTELVNENAQSLMLCRSNEILESGISLIKKNLILTSGKICCFLMDRRPGKEEDSQKKILRILNVSKGATDMNLYRQRYNTQRRYYYAMKKLKKWIQINHCAILDLLTMKLHIIIIKVLAEFTSVNTSASSTLLFLNGLSTMLSLTFDIDLKNNHMLQFTRKAISVHMIVKPKYEDIWNVGILFDYCRGKGSNRNLTNIELQITLTSLLMTICSMRPAEIEGISLRHSVICEQTDKVDFRLKPKTKSRLHSLKLPKTRDRTICPRATFFDWLKRIENKHGRSIRDNKYGALWQNEDITIPAKRGQIQLRLKKLQNMMDIKGKQVYSFRHSAVTQLVVMCLDETLLNTYTGHAWNSKSINEYYVFAVRLKDNELATKLSDIRGQVEYNSISSTQQR
ncbi:MAG: hypothetical protein EZS28_026194 [Streblomastix strix]|uniref:Tyr recombinase domain-containing protein n=1 Tax=Streblomastix strix TaxID=222440 RepID=A0A5J4V6C3_9EUKA|nr:MAG: hypothetical protein EZS28_026194 [Streblomastix strix]